MTCHTMHDIPRYVMLCYSILSVLYCSMLLLSIPYHTNLFCSSLVYAVCFCSFLFASVLICFFFFFLLFSLVLLYYSILYSVLFSSVLYMYYSTIYLLHVTLSLPINLLLLGPEGAESRIRGRSFFKSCRVGMAGSQNRLAVL